MNNYDYKEHINIMLSKSPLARKCLMMSVSRLNLLREHYSKLSDKVHRKRRVLNKHLKMSLICNEIALYRISEINNI